MVKFLQNQSYYNFFLRKAKTYQTQITWPFWQYNLDHVIKFCWWYLTSREANFADIVKIVITLIKATIKNSISSHPVDTWRTLNVRKTFRRIPGRLLNVLYTLNLCLVSMGQKNHKLCIEMQFLSLFLDEICKFLVNNADQNLKDVLLD